jgi:hypothetical protein
MTLGVTKLLRVWCVAMLLLPATGCFWRKQKPKPPAATPPPKPQLPTVEPAPAPPKIETAPPSNTPPPSVSTNLPDVPKPPAQKKQVRRTRARTTTPVKPTDKPTADPGALGENTPTPPPRLGELVTDAQRQDLNRQIDQAAARANASLEKLAAKRLSAGDAETVERIRGFLQQAESARIRDPHTALQLAQRADVLAQDVLKSAK